MIATQPDVQPVVKHKDKALSYYTAIDGLRAIAVLLVLIHHYAPVSFTSLLGLGDMGVDIFFVISGFLITGILLSYKRKASIGEGLKVFYARRFFRIFPLYYLYLIIVAVVVGISSRDAIFSFLYAQNFNIIYHGWGNSYLAHLWSLSVEEQFYLFWPLFILLTPKRFLAPLMKAIIVCSLLFSLVAHLYLHNIFVAYMHILSCMQALAMGGLIAFIHRKEGNKLKAITDKTGNWVLAFTCWVLCLVLCYTEPTFGAFLRPINIAIASLLLINLIAKSTHSRRRPVTGKLERLLNNSALRFIGRISYGIYVYHLMVRNLLDPYVKELTKNSGYSYLLTIPLYTGLTILISYLSFRYFESPVNAQKRRFSIN